MAAINNSESGQFWGVSATESRGEIEGTAHAAVLEGLLPVNVSVNRIICFIPRCTCATGGRRREHVLCTTKLWQPVQPKPLRDSWARSILRDAVLFSHVSPIGPLCQILRQKTSSPVTKEEGQKHPEQPAVGLFIRRAKLCLGGSGPRVRGGFLHAGLRQAVCCARPGTGWRPAPEHPGAVTLPGDTVLSKEWSQEGRPTWAAERPRGCSKLWGREAMSLPLERLGLQAWAGGMDRLRCKAGWFPLPDKVKAWGQWLSDALWHFLH